MTILVADDDPMVRKLLVHFLEHAPRGDTYRGMCPSPGVPRATRHVRVRRTCRRETRDTTRAGIIRP